MDDVRVERKSSLFSFLPWSGGEQILDPEEVAALIKFASEQGVEDGDLVEPSSEDVGSPVQAIGPGGVFKELGGGVGGGVGRSAEKDH